MPFAASIAASDVLNPALINVSVSCWVQELSTGNCCLLGSVQSALLSNKWHLHYNSPQQRCDEVLSASVDLQQDTLA